MTSPSTTFVDLVGPPVSAAWLNAVNTAVFDQLPYTLSGVFNVKQYGAVGDGVTDDTAAIKAALTASTQYSTVYFPPGVYIVNDTLNVPHSQMTIMGNSATIQARASYQFEYIMLATNKDGVVISGLTFDANQTNRTSGQTIRFMGAGFITCNDCSFLNCTAMNTLGYNNIPAVGLAAAGQSVRCKLDGCRLLNCGGTSGTDASDGIFTSGNQNVISNCIATSCTDTGFVIESSNDSVITGCSAYYCQAGGAISNASSDAKYNNIIDGLTVINWKASNTSGVNVSVPTATTGNLYNSIVSNVTMYAELGLGYGVGSAIQVRSVGYGKPIGVTIANCRVLNATTQGIYVNGEQVTITGCHISGTTDACIQFATGSISNHVTGCTLFGGSYGIVAVGTASVTTQSNLCQQNGIGIAATGTSAIYSFMDNVLSASTSRYAKDSGASLNTVSSIGNGLMVNNASGSATSGSVVNKFLVYDATGNSLGYVPVYNV
jgi:parallel beta-helix repeat protein